MTAPAPWSVKGIDPRAREVAKDLARRSGMTLGEWLNHMIVEQGAEPQPQSQHGRFAQADPEPIPLEPSVRGLLGRLERGEREQVAVAARFESLAEELRTDQMRIAERLRRMEQTGEAGGSTEALRALEQTVSRLAGHVYEGEQRAHDAIRDLGACFVKLDGRLRRVEGKGAGDAAIGETLDKVRAEVAAIADDVDRKLGRADTVHAEALEKLGAEVARISERLAERITNSERRSAIGIDEVSEQVSQVAERIHQRQERAAEDVSSRLRQSDERTAQLLEGMRAQIEASFAAAKTQTAPPPPAEPIAAPKFTASVTSGPIAADLAQPPRQQAPAGPVFVQPDGPLPSTREVIDQARAKGQTDTTSETARKETFSLFTPLKAKSKGPGGKGPGGKGPGGSSTLQTALFVTGTAAALGAGVASYVLGVADPTPAAGSSGDAPEVSEPLVPVQAPTVPGEALYAEAVKKIAAGDPDGVEQLRQAATLGNPTAQFHLARLYESGEAGLAKDDAEARRWTEQAARGGDGKAMHNLALYYFEGVGGTKDPATAAQWFRRAADKGMTDSQFNLARLYEDGYGVARDPAAAYRWYLAASRSGDAEARAGTERMRKLLGPAAADAATATDTQ